MFEAGMGTHAPRTGLRFARSEMQAVNSLSIRSMACTCRIGTRQDGFHLIHCDLLEIFSHEPCTAVLPPSRSGYVRYGSTASYLS